MDTAVECSESMLLPIQKGCNVLAYHPVLPNPTMPSDNVAMVGFEADVTKSFTFDARFLASDQDIYKPTGFAYASAQSVRARRMQVTDTLIDIFPFCHTIRKLLRQCYRIGDRLYYQPHRLPDNFCCHSSISSLEIFESNTPRFDLTAARTSSKEVLRFKSGITSAAFSKSFSATR